MTHSEAPDFGLRSGDYGRYRPGFPPSFYDRLEGLAPFADRTILDLGTGPGTVALEVAARGGRVVGVDLAPNQLTIARQRAAERGLAQRCRFIEGRAEALPEGLSTFDWVIAGQCWWWFDVPAAMRQIQQVLRREGHLAVASFNYLPRVCPVAAATEELVLQFNPTWDLAGNTGISPGWFQDLTEGGPFQLVEQFCHDHLEPFTHEAWRGRIRTCNGVGSGGMAPETVARFDAALARLLAARFPEQPMQLPHRVWAIVVEPQGL